MFSTIGRISCGFLAQSFGVFVSVGLFATPGGTIFWWTQSAITVAAMFHTPDGCWPECLAHVLSGMAAYVLFRFQKFSVPLLATVCASNGLGQAFGYVSMKSVFPVLSPKEVGTLRFLAYFFTFPVLLGSLVASVPGSLGFWLLGTDVVLKEVIVNYALGHISGTAALLYPLLVAPTLWTASSKAEKDSNTFHSLACGALVFTTVTTICSFANYYLCGFATIVTLYGLLVAVSMYMDQCEGSLIQLACTGSILGLTAAGRGPFVYVNKSGGPEAVLIGTQMGMVGSVAINASILILVSQLRAMELSERKSRGHAEEVAERQTLELHRIGHDMNNNSTLIQAICEMGEDSDDDRRHALQTIRAVNLLGGVLVSDMVEMVNGKNGDRVLPTEDVDVVEMMRIYAMVASGMLLLQGKQQSVAVHLEAAGDRNGDPVVVHTNRERLHQIMCNLVSNAVKYTKRGEIVLGVETAASDSPAGSVRMLIADSGIGLSEDEVSKVFDLFFRSRRASMMNSGSGMGLFNACKVCDAIGAKIEVSSAGVGKGSTFTLVLPRAVHDDRIAFTTHVPPARFSLRVLVQDDSFVIRKLMTKYLTSFGCEVVESSSAEESRRAFHHSNSDLVFPHSEVDVVITDNFMGDGESGIDFISSIRHGRVKGLSSRVPCILCSGEHCEFDDPGKSLSITKPFSSNDIASALSRLELSDDLSLRQCLQCL